MDMGSTQAILLHEAKAAFISFHIMHRISSLVRWSSSAQLMAQGRSFGTRWSAKILLLWPTLWWNLQQNLGVELRDWNSCKKGKRHRPDHPQIPGVFFSKECSPFGKILIKRHVAIKILVWLAYGVVLVPWAWQLSCIGCLKSLPHFT